jgi:hypothetical protein
MSVLRRRIVVVGNYEARELRSELIKELLNDPNEKNRIIEHGGDIYGIDQLIDRVLADVYQYTLVAEFTAKSEDSTYIVRHYARAKYTEKNRDMPDEAFLIIRVVGVLGKQSSVIYYLPIYWR